ncbi:hypothetical protein FA13DRAFT_1803194 [Coprinellus micaceus]|uniref:DUF6534 domain-containing protein n=1 Tax=Coprinellus micaceus TaxID=71717 RepID=A0A4Y7SAN9_COPMI|nr:hypothetical protein FA13DRAFT_1803194 [Coprinellus micaceus]
MYIWNTGVLALSAEPDLRHIFRRGKRVFCGNRRAGHNSNVHVPHRPEGSNSISQTRSLVAQISVFVIQRGILVTAIQVAVLIAFFASSTNLAWLALHMNVTRLYANTFCEYAPPTIRNPSLNLSPSRHAETDLLSHQRTERVFITPRKASTLTIGWPSIVVRLGPEPEAQWALEKNPHIQLPVVTKTVVVSDV